VLNVGLPQKRWGMDHIGGTSLIKDG